MICIYPADCTDFSNNGIGVVTPMSCKFAALNLKWEDAKYVKAPILTDCPVSIECSAVESTMPGTHELFIGKVESVNVDEEYIGTDGSILWDKMDLM